MHHFYPSGSPTASPGIHAKKTILEPQVLPNSTPVRTCLRNNRAVSLVELVVSLGILSIVAVSLISVTFMIRSTAEQTVYQNTALTLAQGYLEQLRSLDYSSLSNAAAANTVRLSLINASGNNVTDTAGNDLNNGDWAQEIVYLDINAGGQPIQPLTFRFRPILTNMTGTALGVEIVLVFETTYNWGVTRTYGTTLRTVRSSVPTY